MDELSTAAAALPDGEVKAPPRAPEPTATGDANIEILKHNLCDFDRMPDPTYRPHPGIDLAISNTTDTTIASITLEAVLFDGEGKIVDKLRHREICLERDRSRGVHIPYEAGDSERVKSYSVRVVRSTRADAEKVQLRQNIIRTNEAGEEVIRGIVKNVSDVMTDAAVAATFYDGDEEDLGTRVLILKDLEPNAIRQYVLTFKPQAGDKVLSYRITVGELVS